MPIISIAIQKGGSGKTTTAINLSAAFQQMGRSVLLIDLDPQANGTQALGLSDDLEPSIYTLLRTEAAGQPVDTEGAIHRVGTLAFIPASLDLSSRRLAPPKPARSLSFTARISGLNTMTTGSTIS